MKRLVLMIKWLPFTLMAMMVLHCGLLLLGVDSAFLSRASVSPLLYIVMMVLSYKMQFCFYHRLALTYDFLVWVWCWLKEYGILDSFLHEVRFATFAIGLVIITVILTAKRYEKRCGGNDGCA